MKLYDNPSREKWDAIIERPVSDSSSLIDRVKPVLEDIRKNGDTAVRKYTEQFDKVTLDTFKVSEEEIDTAISSVDESLKESIRIAIQNVSTFHQAQLEEVKVIETMPGVKCWRRSSAIQKVGLYIPGGTAPLFSTVIMLAVPAKIAGCKEIILCTPPSKDGSIHPAILFTAKEVGVTQIYKIGGSQAIGAMAYGTESVPSVYKIFGPGNQYVTIAKQLVSLEKTAIDMPAGPSEVAVVCDHTSNPVYIAADLLAQAEHGVDSQSILIGTDLDIINRSFEEVKRQLEDLPRADIARKAIENSYAVHFEEEADAIDFTNKYAAEHLIISTDGASEFGDQIHTAGSIFLGHYTPESAGDYASGTNHTLPTNAYANMYSGVSLDSFIKKITVQEISKEGIDLLGPHVENMAEAEQLQGHKNAVTVRLKKS